MRKFRVLLLLSLVVLSAFVAGAQDAAATPTIAEIVVASTTAETPEFTVLLAAVAAADPAVLELLSNPEASVTVFAPTDAAFTAAFEALGVTAADVLADPAALTEILLYHVVPGAFDAAYVTSFEPGTLLGTLLPGTALALNISEEGAFVNEAQIVATDVAASNGFVHVIDGVLLPPAAEEAMEGEMEMEAPTANIAETVVAAAGGDMPEFTVLLAAVVAADPSILETLSNGGPFTVFAPTDAAFGALLEALGATADDVLANTELLNTVLAYHVVPGTFAAADVIGAAGEEGFSIATLLPGGALDIAVVDGGVVINGTVNVVATDVYATNGVIHVIDAVLVPAVEE